MGAVDVDLNGSVLSVNYNDGASDSLNLAINTTGFETSGSNVTSGTGNITELNVTGANTSNTSNFTLTEVSQNLSGGLSVSGVALGINGDTTIDVGTGEFTVQEGLNSTYPGGNIISQGGSSNLTITAGNITATRGIGVAGASNATSPELGDLTINGSGPVGLNTSQVVTTGNITANPQIRLYQNTTLISGAGSINLAGGVNNGSKALTIGDINQTGDIFISGLQLRHLEVGAGAFDVKLDGAMHLTTNLTAPTQFKNTGKLTLIGQGSSFFGGIDTTNTSHTYLAGCLATFGKDIILGDLTMLNSSYANRFDTRWTQTQGGTAGGGDITIANFTSLALPMSKSVEFDIGNGTSNTVTFNGSVDSSNKLYFKGIGDVDFMGDATLSGGVIAQNLSFEENSTPALNFNGNVTLTGAMEFAGTSANFANGVQAAGNDLTLNFTETTSLDGFNNVGNFTSKGAVDLGGNFTTSGFQKYEGNVSLLEDAELAASTVEFEDGVDGNSNNLTLTPSSSLIKLDGITLSDVDKLTIGGDLGLSGSLSALEIDIQGNTTLIGDANLTASAASGISIPNGTIDGGYSLAVNGNVAFNGAIGDQTPLASLTVVGGNTSLGGNITTTGDQTFESQVTISSDTTFSGSNISFAGFDGGGFDVAFNSTDTDIDASASSFANVADLTVTGTSTLNGTIETTGNQSYEGMSKLIGDTTLISGAGSINLAGGVNNGSKALTIGDINQTGDIFISGLQLRHLEVGAGAFDVKLDGAMHLTTNLTAPTQFKNTGKLTLIGQGSSFFGGIDTTNTSHTYLAGCLATFGKDIILGDLTMLNSSYANRFDTRWTQTQGGTAGGGDITIANFTSLALPMSKSVEFDIGNGTSNTVTFNGSVDSSNKLYFKGIGDVDFMGDATLSGGVIAQNLSFEENSTPALNFNGNVTLTGAMEFAGTSANFANGVQAAGNDLTLNFTETTSLDGFNNVGNFTSKGAVDLGGNFATSGSQTYEGNLSLLGDSNLTGTDFNSSGPIEGNDNNLTLNMSGLTSLSNGATGLNNLDVNGNVSLAGNFSTSGTQTYNGDLSLEGDTSLNGSSASFSGVTGNNHSLSLSFNGTNSPIIIDGKLAGLNNLTVENDVTLSGSIATSGSQTYNAGANLAGTTSLIGTTASFNNGIDGNDNDLSLNMSGLTALGDGISNIANFSSTGDVSLAGSIATSGAQTYGGATSLTGDTTLSGTAASFNNGIDGNGSDLSLNMSGLTTLDQGISNVGDFSSTGDVSLAGNFSTTGTQSFDGNVSLSGDTALSGTTASIAGVVGNDNNLSVNFSGGTVSINGAFTGIADFVAETDVSLEGSIATSGSQTYAANATLSDDTTLSGTAASFNNGISGGGNNLSLDMSGLTALGGGISNIANFSSTGDVSLTGNFTTSGSQAYGGATNLTDDTVLSGTTASFNSSINGNGNNLSLNFSGDSVAIDGALVGIADFVAETDVSLEGSITTTGSQTYESNAALAGDTTLSGANVSFNNGIDGNNNNLSLDMSGLTALGGGISNIANFSSTGDVSLTGNFTTSGSQAYGGATNLTDDTVLSGTTASFNSSINGNGNNLSLNMSGPTSLSNGAVGLNSLDVNGNVSLAGDFSTTGSQTYTGDQSLEGDTSLSGSSASFSGVTGNNNSLSLNFTQSKWIIINGNLTGLNDLTVDVRLARISGSITTTGSQTYAGNTSLDADTTLSGTNATFNSSIDGKGNNLSLDMSGLTALDAGISNIANFSSTGDVSLAGNFSTSGSQTLAGNVSLSGDTALSGTTGSLAGVVGNNNNLSLNFSGGSVAIDGAFSNVAEFVAETDVSLNGSISTSGSQTFKGKTSLAGDTTLSGTTASFNSTLSGGGNDLSLNISGLTTFTQGVNSIKNFSSLGDVSLAGNFSSSGSQVFSGNVSLLGDSTLTGTDASFAKGMEGAGNNLTMNFSGTFDTTNFNNLASLNLIGSGTTVLTGTNSNSGGITIENGTVAGTTDSLTGDITNNGTVRFDQSSDGTYAGNMNGSGSLEKSGTGEVTLSGTNTYSGGTTVNNSTLAGTTNSLQGAITNNGKVTFEQSTNGTYAGNMSGSGSLEKNDTGTVTLSGTNTYTGGTTLNDGELDVSGSLSSAITINSGATLTGTGSISAVTVNDGARLATHDSSNSLNVGNISFNGGGIFEWNVSNVSGSAGNDWSYINSNGSFTLIADATTPFVIEASTLLNSNFDPEAKKYEWNIASFSGEIQSFDRDAFSVDSSGMTGADGRFYVTGDSNNLTLVYKTGAVWNSGNGNWSSLTQWEDASGPEDTDNIEFVGAGGTSTNDNGYITTIDGLLFTSDVSGAYTLDGSALTISLEGITNKSDKKHTIAMDLAFPTDQEINAANGALEISGNISGAGALIKNGSEIVTLSGTNTYSGGTTVNNGTLAGTTNSLQGTITNNGKVTFEQSSDGTYAGIMSGSGSLEKAGNGIVTLNGNNSFSGGTILNAGTLEVASGNALGSGSLTLNGGKLLVQSSSEMQANLGFGGNFTWNNGTVAFYDTGASPKSDELKISVGGDLLNGGSGGQFDFSQVEALDAGTYALLAYNGTSDFQIGDFAASAGEGTTLNGTFSINNGTVLYEVTGASSSGPVLENKGSVNTPVVSDYTVDQVIITRDQENIVNSLTFENNGTLAVETGGKLEVSSGKLTVSDGSDSTVSGGKLTTSTNDLVKDGDGQLNLENEVEVTNDAKVEAGLLAIKGDGILKAKNLIVQSGGTLGGDGTAEADVQVFGTLAVGNSPGTLNITGDLTLDAGSTTEVEIESLTNYDQTIAIGDIALNGTLTATTWNNGTIQVGDKYDVFQSTAGTITGEFHTYNAPSNLRVRLLNNGSTASLRFAPETYTLMAQTQNQFNVAAALDSFIPATAGDAMTVSTALDELTAAEYPAAFHQTMPYFYESMAEILLDQGFHQTKRLQQRLALLRSINKASTNENSGIASGWRAWTHVNVDTMSANAFDAAPGYDNERDGFQVGADYYGNNNIQLGVFAGRDFNKVDYSADSKLRTDSIQFGGYASYSKADGTYFDAILSSGLVDMNTRRGITFSTIDRNASAEVDSFQFNASVGGGRDFKHGNFTFGPHAALELSSVTVDGFNEQGADSLNLRLKKQSIRRLSAEVGVHVSYDYQLKTGLTLRPEVRISLDTNLSDNGRTIHASFDGVENTSLDYVPSSRDRDGISTAVGVNLISEADWSASLFWNTKTLERDGKSNSISLSLDRKF